MMIEAFFDPNTCTLSYVVWDPRSGDCVVIDPVLDYEPFDSQTYTESIDKIFAFIRAKKLLVHFALETHAHADHFSASQLLKHRCGASIGIGVKICLVQETFKQLLGLPAEFRTDGSQFDRLIEDGEVLQAGNLSIESIATPGHTPACLSYKINDAVFTGDALLMHDYGTGRADFPRGSAEDLYRSVHECLYRLPNETRVFVGHDYLPNGRPLIYETTIGDSKRNNPQLNERTSKSEFVNRRNERDSNLPPPQSIFPCMQVNINAGRLPEPHSNGKRYLRIPLYVRCTVDGCRSSYDDQEL